MRTHYNRTSRVLRANRWFCHRHLVAWHLFAWVFCFLNTCTTVSSKYIKKINKIVMMKEPTFLKLDIWTFICHDSNNSWNQMPMDIAHVLFNSISFISRQWGGWYDTSRDVLYNQCKPNPREFFLFYPTHNWDGGFCPRRRTRISLSSMQEKKVDHFVALSKHKLNSVTFLKFWFW